VGGERLIERAKGLDHFFNKNNTSDSSDLGSDNDISDADTSSDENIPLSVLRKRLRNTDNSDSEDTKGVSTKKRNVTDRSSNQDDPSTSKLRYNKTLAEKRVRDCSPEASNKRIAPDPIDPMEVESSILTDDDECEAAMEVHFIDCQTTPWRTAMVKDEVVKPTNHEILWSWGDMLNYISG
jgi:hypothetical protein